MNPMEASSSLSVFKLALLLLLLLTVSAPGLARASSVVTADKELVREVVEATLRAQEAKKVNDVIPLLLGNHDKQPYEYEDPEGLRACAPGGVPCDPRLPNYCCSKKCTLFFFMNMCT